MGIVALTGGTGFIGRHLARRLAADGWHVRLLVRSAPAHPQLTDLPIEAQLGDLADWESLERFVADADVVIHAAGRIKARTREDFVRDNVEGSANLGRAIAHAALGARVIAISSLAAREPGLSTYAATKRAGEAALVSPLGASCWCILRPAAVYGPWDTETLILFKAVARRLGLLLNGPDARLSVIHVDDLATAVAALCQAELHGSTYELADPVPAGYSWHEILDGAAAAVGTRPLRLRAPAWSLRAIAGATTALSPFFNRTPMLSTGKAQEILHPDWSCAPDRCLPPDVWRPHIPLREGFSRTARWYRDAGWL